MTRGFSDDDRPHGRGPLVEIAAELVRESERAFCINDGGGETWVPKSLVQHDAGSNHSIFTMPEWLAIERELI